MYISYHICDRIDFSLFVFQKFEVLPLFVFQRLKVLPLFVFQKFDAADKSFISGCLQVVIDTARMHYDIVGSSIIGVAGVQV